MCRQVALLLLVSTWLLRVNILGFADLFSYWLKASGKTLKVQTKYILVEQSSKLKACFCRFLKVCVNRKLKVNMKQLAYRDPLTLCKNSANKTWNTPLYIETCSQWMEAAININRVPPQPKRALFHRAEARLEVSGAILVCHMHTTYKLILVES